MGHCLTVLLFAGAPAWLFFHMVVSTLAVDLEEVAHLEGIFDALAVNDKVGAGECAGRVVLAYRSGGGNLRWPDAIRLAPPAHATCHGSACHPYPHRDLTHPMLTHPCTWTRCLHTHLRADGSNPLPRAPAQAIRYHGGFSS